MNGREHHDEEGLQARLEDKTTPENATGLSDRSGLPVLSRPNGSVGAHGPSTLRKHGLPPDVDAGQGVGQGSQRWTGVGLRKDVG